jgi:hypothetical protein
MVLSRLPWLRARNGISCRVSPFMIAGAAKHKRIRLHPRSSINGYRSSGGSARGAKQLAAKCLLESMTKMQ